MEQTGALRYSLKKGGIKVYHAPLLARDQS